MRRSIPSSVTLGDDVVTLRPWSPDDVGVLTEIWQDAELQRRFAVTSPISEASSATYVGGVTQMWREGTQVSLAIEADARVVGGCDLDDLDEATPQLGYWLAADVRGRGFASRAGALLVDWAQDALGVERLELEVEPDNEASIAVATRLGFSRIDGVERADGARRLLVYELMIKE